jgi:phosphoenolpyruvate carboxykinase (ATP)
MNNNTPFTKSISLTDLGIENAKIHYQLSASEHKKTIALGQGRKPTGALAINTGEFTGRSPQDRFIVKDAITEDKVWWGKVNIPFELLLLMLYKKVATYLSNKEIYVRDSYVCADPNYRLNE